VFKNNKCDSDLRLEEVIFLGNSPEVISIVKANAFSRIFEKVKNGFELMGGANFNHDDSVVIKPNLCCIKRCETGATTDPKVVEGVVRYLQDEFGVSDITIVESDGRQVLADMAFKLLGYEELSKKLGLKLINLSKAPFSIKTFDENVFVKKIRIPHVMKDADWVISIPKIKTHTMCSFGGAMKNQYGCNPFAKKTIYHKKIHDAIVDLNVAFKPNLVVVDGIVAMEGRGPTDGIPVKMNTLIFGRDAVAVDHLIARIIGINPNRVRYLVEARKRRLGTTNYKIVGTSLKEVERKFGNQPRQRNLYGLLSRHDS